VAPLTAMKVAVAVSLVMVQAGMVCVVVAVPAIVIAPVPAAVPCTSTSMLSAILSPMFECMTDIAAVAMVTPIVSSITIVGVDDRLADLESET